MKIEKLVLWLLHTNCYIIYDENTNNAAVIDPAGNCEIIIDKIENLKLNVKYIILTHAHIDHMIALDELKEYSGAKLVMHEKETELYTNGDWNLSDHFKKECPKSETDILVKDNDTLKMDSVTFKFIHTPGHTKGGMCILTEDKLFSGDTLFQMSIGKTDYYGGNMAEEINSIKQKLMVLDDNITVYPGHGDSTTIGFERKNNMFLMW